MAKQSGLLAKAKATKVKHSGTGNWEERLKPEQQKEFREFIAWLKTGKTGIDRPSCVQCAELIKEEFNHTISERTIRGLINAK